MSSMLEQAIIDAAALREAALKNAEQALIEKYAPQIKEAVESMLEGEQRRASYDGRTVSVIHEADEDGMVTVSEDNGKPFTVKENELSELIQEEEEAAPAGDGTIEAPAAFDSRVSADQAVNLSMQIDQLEDEIDIDLGSLEKEMSTTTDATEDPLDDLDLDLGLDLGDDTPDSKDDDLDSLLASPETTEDPLAGLNLQEMIDAIQSVLEEEMTVDMGAAKTGTFETNQGELEYQADMEDAARVHAGKTQKEREEKELDEDEEDMTGVVNELHETISALAAQNEKLESVIYQLSDKLEETLLSNAKLIYQNRTLSDASLNERQKNKIVEAIARAESPKEAKQLHETLKATVGSQTKKGPQSLSESVNRRSNLSAMLNTRQNLRENKTLDPFMEKMQKLAGIK
mgnify:CR=1 FL=1